MLDLLLRHFVIQRFKVIQKNFSQLIERQIFDVFAFRAKKSVDFRMKVIGRKACHLNHFFQDIFTRTSMLFFHISPVFFHDSIILNGTAQPTTSIVPQCKNLQLIF